jgi:uncharacterized protein DUF5681
MLKKIFNAITREYEVGFGKPPKHTQFKKGQSGNPAGRPRFAFEEDEAPLRRYMLEPITVNVKGKKKQMPTVDVIVKTIIQQAVQGCRASQKLIIQASGGLTALREEWKRQMTKADEAYIEWVRKSADEWLTEEEKQPKTAKKG